eukprot:COSAG04_NODE_1801_length_5550_cov_4.388369_4_plen_70_part_00
MRLLDANMRDVSDVEVKQGKNKVPNLLPPEVKTKTTIKIMPAALLWPWNYWQLMRDIKRPLFKAFCEQV